MCRLLSTWIRIHHGIRVVDSFVCARYGELWGVNKGSLAYIIVVCLWSICSSSAIKDSWTNRFSHIDGRLGTWYHAVNQLHNSTTFCGTRNKNLLMLLNRRVAVLALLLRRCSCLRNSQVAAREDWILDRGSFTIPNILSHSREAKFPAIDGSIKKPAAPPPIELLLWTLDL